MWIYNAGEYWKCQHGLTLSWSSGECLSDTQWTIRSQEGRNFRSLSNDDLKTFLLSHTPYFPRHFYSTAMAELRQSIYDFLQVRDAFVLFQFALKDSRGTDFACHPDWLLGFSVAWKFLFASKALQPLLCSQWCSSPCLSCSERLHDVCAQRLSPQSRCLGIVSPSTHYC